MTKHTLFTVLAVLASTTFGLGCQPVADEEEDIDSAESVLEESGNRRPPVVFRDGNMYPEGSYVTGIQPFFDDASCTGSMAWGTSITPSGSGSIFYLVVTKDTTPVTVWYPGDEVLPAGYGLGKDGACEPINPVVKPPGGKWLRWFGTPLSEF